MSLDILYILKDRDSYIKYNKYILSHTLSKEQETIIADMAEWWAMSADDEIDWASFGSWFRMVKHPMFKEEKQEVYQAIFTQLQTYVPSAAADEIVESLLERSYAAQLADVALSMAEGNATGRMPDVEHILTAYKDQSKKATQDSSEEVSDSIEDIFAKMEGGEGLEWRLDCLNQSLGPLRKGNFIVLGKRPESGGTTFCSAESTWMAAQMKPNQSVLWFNNEQIGWEVKWRVFQAALGWDRKKMEDNKLVLQEHFEKVVKGESRIKIFDCHGRSIFEIEEIIKRNDPGLIIFDQLWKVRGYEKSAGGDVQRLTAIFAKARELAHNYAPVIAVHQADGSAAGEKYIPMESLYMSKTGCQGEADAIITIGATYEPGMEHMRYINIPKNKLLGGAKSKESLRHGKFELGLQADIARFVE
jgi:replicative DNA helicase